MTEQPPTYTYFSAADRQTELFVDASQRDRVFNTSLVQGVLFDDGIVIPDVFHFISTGLRNHVLNHHGRRTRSLLEAAMVAGIARPAFRRPEERTYRGALLELQRQGLQGLLPASEVELLADKFDRCRPDVPKDVYWPAHSVGERYAERLVRLLRPDLAGMHDGPPVNTKDMARMWTLTQRWRQILQDVLLEGDTDPSTVKRGLRRGDYMNAIGHSLGLSGPIQDMKELYNAAESRQDKLAIKVLCLWINEAYHYNQAREFGLEPAWSQYDPRWSAGTMTVMEGGDARQIRPETESFVVKAMLPRPEVLARADGTALLGVRNAKVGQEFFAALRQWRKSPGAYERRNLETLFSCYTAELSNAIRAENQGDRLLMVMGRYSNAQGVAAGAATLSLASLADERIASASNVLIAVGALAWTTYAWWSSRSTPTAHTVRRPGLTIESDSEGSA